MRLVEQWKITSGVGERDFRIMEVRKRMTDRIARKIDRHGWKRISDFEYSMPDVGAYSVSGFVSVDVEE